MLELKTTYHGGILDIEMYGALDSLTAPDFKHWLTQKSASGYHYFAINCAGLEYISSRGIGVITELNAILNAAHSRLVFYHVSNEVLNLLNFLKLSDEIPIVENFAQVKEKFGDKARQKHQRSEAPKEPHRESPVEESFKGISSTPEKQEEPADTISKKTSFNTTESGHPKRSEQNTADSGTLVEEYIDLNKIQLKTEYDVAHMNIVFCPNCGQNLRVSKKGLYLCPDCRIKFNYPFQ